MELTRLFTFIRKRFVVAFFIGTILILLGGFSDSGTFFRIPPAMADAHYGILGRPAPELNLSGWIDGNGQKIEPVRLEDYRGKVIYLYFFQDW